MKQFGVVSTVFLLFVLLGATALGDAQQEHQNEKHAQHQQQAKNNEQHAQQQQHAQNNQQHGQQQQHAQNNQQHGQRQQHAQNEHQQHAQNEQHAQNQHPAQLQRTQHERHAQEGEQRDAWQQHRAHDWDSEHRNWQQRGGYNGYRIPDGYYGSYYGRGHGFRIFDLPFMVVGGYPRFQYGGYWFSCVDPWPGDWAANWYETDDVYVDYVGDGYYLY